MKKQQGERNRGWFVKGPDPRRHKLTKRERSLGYMRAMERCGRVSAIRYAWLYRRIRSFYRQRRASGRGRGPGPGLAGRASAAVC